MENKNTNSLNALLRPNNVANARVILEHMQIQIQMSAPSLAASNASFSLGCREA